MDEGSLESNAGDGQAIASATADADRRKAKTLAVARIYGNELALFLSDGAGGLVCIDGRRALALELATESEQMVMHQTADHIEPQQNAVRPMTNRPHESAEIEIS